jgi:hypothetical protein
MGKALGNCSRQYFKMVLRCFIGFSFCTNYRIDSRRETLKLNAPMIKVSSKEARRKSSLNDQVLEEGDETEDKENIPGILHILCKKACGRDFFKCFFFLQFVDKKSFKSTLGRIVEKSSPFQSPLSKFPALMERLGLDPETDDSTSSIVDVDNDQV